MWFVLVLAACSDSTDSSEPLVCTETWENFGHGFVTTWCTSCHSVNLVGEEARYLAPATVNLDTLELVRLWQNQLGVATGPDPQMPPSGGVPEGEVARFENWLACGLPGEGTVPVSTCADAVAVPGDVAIADDSDADALCAGGFVTIGGALVVTGGASLGCVCEVGGDLLISGGAADLPALVTVGGSMEVSDAAVAVLVPELKSIEGRLVAEQAVSLEALDVTELETVGGDVVVTDAPILGELLLERLVSVPGSLRVERAGVTALDFTRIVDVTGDFALQDLPELVQIRGNTGALASIGGSLRFVSLPVWTQEYGFARLLSVGGDLEVVDVDSTEKWLGFTELASIGGSLRLVDNDAMTQYDGFDQVATVGGDLVVEDHPTLFAVDRLEALATVGGAVVIQGNPNLLVFDGLANVTEVGSLTLDGLALATVMPSLSLLTTVHGDLRIGGSSALLGVTMPSSLVSVSGSVVVHDVPATAFLSWGGTTLSNIGGDLIVQNTGFLALAIPSSLRTIGGDLVVDGNTDLTDVAALASLTSVTGDLVVTGNTTLPMASATALPSEFTVGGSITISGNGP